MSLLIACSFARASVKALTVEQKNVRDEHGRVIRVERRPLTRGEERARYEGFCRQFGFSPQLKRAYPHLSSFVMPEEKFTKACNRLLDVYNRKWPGGQSKRVQWTERFSLEAWEQLPRSEKVEHTMTACDACVDLDPLLHAAFPTQTAKDTQTTVVRDIETTASMQSLTPGQTRTSATSTAMRCLLTLQEKLQEDYGESLESHWVAHPNSGLQLTPSRSEIRQKMRETERKAKEKREEEYRETDFTDLFGSTMSQRAYERQRKNECLEKKEKAEERMRDRLQGARAAKAVSLNYPAMKWDWQGLIQEAREWQDGEKVNWTALARQYGIHEMKDTSKLSGKGGQIARAVVEEAGINTSAFFSGKGAQTGAPRARRAVRRTSNGVAVPQHVTYSDLHQQVEEKYESGAICRAICIVPRSYDQIIIREDGGISTRKREVFGQKVNVHRLLELFCTHNKDILAMTNYKPSAMSADEVQQRPRLLGQVSYTE